MTFTAATIRKEGGVVFADLLAAWTFQAQNEETPLGFDGWVEQRFPAADRFGARWPDNYPVCGVCRQPDSCGDCNHQQLPADQVQLLGGVPAPADRAAS